MNAVLPEIPAVDPLPDCWADHEVFGADGKAIKHVKRLLKPLRVCGRAFWGPCVGGLEPADGSAVAMVGHLDGEAGEAALTEVLLPKLAAAAGPGKQWVVVGPTLLQPEFPAAGVESRGPFPHPLLHQYGVRPRSARPARESRDAKGHRIVQEWGWLGKVEKAGRQYVRRITKHLRDGKEIGVVTDLLDEVKYPAEAMLTTYQSRWGIETVFHQITDVFSLRHLIGTMPKAVLFQMSFCLLMYNALLVVCRPGVVPGM